MCGSHRIPTDGSEGVLGWAGSRYSQDAGITGRAGVNTPVFTLGRTGPKCRESRRYDGASSKTTLPRLQTASAASNINGHRSKDYRRRVGGAASEAKLRGRRFRDAASESLLLERSLRRHRLTDATSQTLCARRRLGDAV